LAKQSTFHSEDGVLWKPLLVFLIPLMLSNTLQSISGTISTIFVGRWLGEKALAATSAVFPVMFFFISLLIGLGSASSVLIGQAYGGGQTERMKATAGTSLTFSFLLGTVAALLGVLFTRQLFQLIGTPASIIDLSVSFARVMFASLPFFFVYINYTTFLRGTGDSKTPFYFLIMSTALTILLTPVFLFGWLGLPPLGVTGAALASVCANILTLIAFIAYLIRIKHPLALDKTTLQKLRLDPQIMRLMIKIGIPSSVQMVFVSLSEVAVIFFVNAYGATATAAYGAVMQVITYVQMPAMSLGIAAGIFGSQLIGANRQKRLGELIKSAVVLNYILGAIIVGIVLWFSHGILSLFLVDPDTLQIAQRLSFIVLWSYMIFGNAMIISGIMRSSGTVFWPTLLGIISIWGIEIPTAWLLSRAIGLEGIWMAYPICYLFSLAVQYIYYRMFWRGKTHQRFFASNQAS
jgi:putative MATE family efflux protein